MCSVIGAEEKEHPSIPGGLRESSIEEKMLDLRLEQSISLQSELGESKANTKPGAVGEARM